MNYDKNSYNNEKIEFFRWQLEYVIDQIKMADNKINFLLAIYLALVGLIISRVGKVIGIFQNTNVCLILKVIIGIIGALFLCCAIKFFYHFINTIKPRTNPREILREENYKSVIFWKDIYDMGYKNFNNVSLEIRYEDLEKQIFVNSYIAKVKFGNVTIAYKFLIPTSFLFLILFCLTYLIGG
ncbi:MAG: Pycsar system effector family protein [Candidatus Helarchaeota archaeon]